MANDESAGLRISGRCPAAGAVVTGLAMARMGVVVRSGLKVI
jgi:hypothetical protein